jgi:arylsulfatase A-like enzyme
VQWLEENHRAGPWFLWVDFFDPHEPWDPPEYLVRRYDPEYVGTPMIHPNYGRIDVYTPEELHNLWAHYAAEAELVDRALGRVLQKLDDLQLWDETLVAVTSDHGFSIGDHGRAGKTGLGDRSASHWPLYPEISHVPFLLAGGGVPAGGSLDLLAQPMDILPTLAELAGVTLAPAQDFDGSSFAAAVRSGQGGHRDVAVCGGFVGDDAADELPARSTTPFVVSGRWGYTPHGVEAAEELYDLDADPWAETNVAEGNAAVLREMNGKLVEYLRAHRASDRTIARWRR